MSLLGIIETLRRNLKGVIVACWVLLGLLVLADVARIVTGFGHHEAAAAEHTVAPAAEHAPHAAAAEHTAHAEHAAPAEHSDSLKSEISDLKSAPHGAEHAAEHEAHGFWAKAYHIAENVPVFWTLFGFLGCVVIVVVSKSYGHFGVSVKEDYYGE
ncbi:MAG TPA: hypothetical protein VK178_17745 [Opitutaceae bacterium]|nr:hypothetical protein [Opitutaceae bacterium]